MVLCDEDNFLSQEGDGHIAGLLKNPVDHWVQLLELAPATGLHGRRRGLLGMLGPHHLRIMVLSTCPGTLQPVRPCTLEMLQLPLELS